MMIPKQVAEDLQPWFGDGLEIGRVPLIDRRILSFIFGFLGQWTVTWNGTVHLTGRVPFLVEETGVRSQKERMDPNEARATALWLIAHECLQVQQQQEMDWVRFLLAYSWEWLRCRGSSRNKFEGPGYELGGRVYRAFKERPRTP